MQAGQYLINITCNAHTYGLPNILVLHSNDHRFKETKPMPVSQVNYTSFSFAELINQMVGTEVVNLDESLGYHLATFVHF